MSQEEKGAWVSALVMAATSATYASIILGRADGAALASVPYVSTMLWMIGIAVVGTILGYIAVAVANPSEADKRDQRDRDINRHGEYFGGIVLGVAMLAPLGLAMAEADHFWIANAIYAAFIAGSLVAQTVKILAYRRGL